MGHYAKTADSKLVDNDNTNSDTENDADFFRQHLIDSSDDDTDFVGFGDDTFDLDARVLVDFPMEQCSQCHHLHTR